MHATKSMVIRPEHSKVSNVTFKIRNSYKVSVMVILIYGIFFFLLCCLLKWQMSICRIAQQQGDIENNIPSVEILVQTMKKCVWARCKCYVPECPKGRTNNLKQDEIKENIQKECKKNRSWKRDLRHINQLIFHLWLDNFNV